MEKRIYRSIGIFALVALSLLSIARVSGQTINDDAAAVAKAAAAASPSAVQSLADTGSNFLSPEQQFRWLQEQNKRTELVSLVIAMIVALLIVLAFIRTNVDHTAEQLVRACGLVLVIFGTLFIAVYASTADQLTAPIGILGAIAGYLFGSAQHRTARTASGGNGKEQTR